MENDVYSLRLGDNIKDHKDYPISLDGHIFRGQDILPLIQSIEFENPNKLESRLQKYKNRFTLYWTEQVLIGITDNKVSSFIFLSKVVSTLVTHLLNSKNINLRPVWLPMSFRKRN